MDSWVNMLSTNDIQITIAALSKMAVDCRDRARRDFISCDQLLEEAEQVDKIIDILKRELKNRKEQEQNNE